MHEINQLRPVNWQLHGAATIILSVNLLAPALAQQVPGSVRLLPEDEARGLGGPQHNFDFLPPGASSDNYQTAGFFGQKLRPYLAGNTAALAHLNEYRRQKTFFLIDRLVAVGSFSLYGEQILGNGDRQYFNSTQQIAVGVFVTSLLATVFINRNTNSHLQRAVKSYNNNVVHGGIWQRLQPAAMGFAAASTGQPLLSLRWALR
ncbi:hypothetical protein [Hymenobacter siberiensis]|uniref:hypothetical protein n=1 Tax=Hymenobacter siberiensis TaxID=2848396 RepID=UPI001C1DF203|nr:hypothetical protein [Hymenobacter siberiensis]MBU6120039.1 hypothetical protein [Hymenobacter siberiensis]